MKIPKKAPEDNWTVEEVALRLRVTEDCVRKWLTRGLLRRIKAGSRTLIPESAIQAFLTASDRKSSSAA